MPPLNPSSMQGRLERVAGAGGKRGCAGRERKEDDREGPREDSHALSVVPGRWIFKGPPLEPAIAEPQAAGNVPIRS